MNSLLNKVIENSFNIALVRCNFYVCIYWYLLVSLVFHSFFHYWNLMTSYLVWTMMNMMVISLHQDQLPLVLLLGKHIVLMKMLQMDQNLYSKFFVSNLKCINFISHMLMLFVLRKDLESFFTKKIIGYCVHDVLKCSILLL